MSFPLTGIVHFTILLSCGMVVAFILLLLRRWLSEQQAASRKAMQTLITRSYIQRISGTQSEDRGGRWPKAFRILVVTNLLLLLRGGEREQLMQIAELDGLLDASLDLSRSLRRARRIDAIRMLQLAGSDACVARLRSMMSADRSHDVRLNAAFALASLRQLPAPRETIALLGIFDRQPSRLEIAVLRASAPDYAKHFHHILGDVMPHTRRATVIDALGWSGDMSMLPVIARAAEIDNAELRCAALRAAAQLGHPASGSWVAALLDDPSEIVRLQAANSCGTLRLQAAVPRLREMARDKDIWVRLRASEALQIISPSLPKEVRAS